MTRVLSIFTLSDAGKLNEARELLMETRSDLPDSAAIQVFTFSDDYMPEMLPGLFFGDLVQCVDFETYKEAASFEESEAYKNQKKRTRGYFTNMTSMRYNLDDASQSGN